VGLQRFVSRTLMPRKNATEAMAPA
jgi:hypothetical protein